MNASTAQNLPWTRPLLIVSAAIAILSVSTSLFRDGENVTAPTTRQQNAPTIDEVITRLEERLKQEPSSMEGWRLLGWAYTQASRNGDAADAYRRATELDPGNAELWSARGEALLAASQQGFPDEARAAFEKALSLDAKNVGARFFLGAAKAEGGNARAAIDDWIALLNDAPPGAPWAAVVRQKIEDVAAANGIDVVGRLSTDAEPRR